MSKLKKLIAVRHCQDWSDDELSSDGIEQAKKLANSISEVLAGSNGAVVLSSPPGRATMTAELIASQLKVEVSVVGELELDLHHHGTRQLEAIKDFIETHESVVVVTHFEAPSGIMDALSRKFFDKTYGRVEAEKGTGFVFSCASGEIGRVS